MNVNDVEIQNYKKSFFEETDSVRRTMYTGLFHCPGLPLHGKMLKQISITKVARKDEFGRKEWGDPKTTFHVIGLETQFYTIEGLITYYNQPDQFRTLVKCRVKLRVSTNGDIIVNGGERRVYTVNGNKEVELKGKLYSVARLVALAFHGEPEVRTWVVQFRDDDKTNTHYTNLYYGPYKKGRPIKLSDRKKDRIRNLYSNGGTFKGLGREFGVSPRTIKRICENK